MNVNEVISDMKNSPASDEAPKAVNWAVLFVRTNCENRVVKALKRRLDGEAYVPFLPTKEYAYNKSGTVKKREVRPCFPGYVFIKVNGGAEDFYRDVNRLALAVEGALFFLCYGGDKRDIFMRTAEREYMERLLKNGPCVKGSIGFKEGDRIRIISGGLCGLESAIIRVNKSKRTADVMLPMMGELRKFTFMLELVEKV